MDYSLFHPVEQDEMKSCVLPIIFKCFDSKPIGTDLVKMGLFKDSVLAIKIDGKRIETIEVDLTDYHLEQSRGLQNKSTRYHKRIVDLVNANMEEIRIRNTKHKIAV